jgi:hypothetical protein
MGVSKGQAGESKDLDVGTIGLGPKTEELTGGLAARAGRKVADWRTLIISEDESERMLAREMLLKRHTESVDYLVSVVKMPVRRAESFYSPTTSRNIAIDLLGGLRSKKAIPALVDWIFPKSGQSIGVWELSLFSPAGAALVEIGLPAVGPLVERLASESDAARKGVIVRILVAIKGLRGTELLFEDLVGREKEPNRHKNLKSAQELLAQPKMRKIFENIDERRQRDWGYY